MAILVTGGMGYIGSHTCVELLNAGYEVVIVDNLINSKLETLERIQKITEKTIKFYKINMLDKQQLEQVFTENSIDSVIHFAGLKSVAESVNMPLIYYRNNLLSTITLCEIMQKYQVKNLVFSSSASVYGIPKEVPISEESILNVQSPYGRTKQIIEQMLGELYQADQQWSITSLRYFNPIGAHDSGKLGEDPLGEANNLMPNITNVAIGVRKTLQIFGSNYPTMDGTAIRDYTHVMDLASGHVNALKKNMKSIGIGTYNLGTGNGYSVLEIINTFEKVTGIKVPYEVIEPRPGDVGICYANPIKAQIELGWKPTRGIEEMCMDSWKWQVYRMKADISKVQFSV
nr:UDP-glucose 4-epimerase GalE [Heyndrickxia oleronia]